MNSINKLNQISSDSVAQYIPLTTIIIVCFNHARFVEQALESARSQLYTNVEIIIIDDCSVDNSVAVIEQWLAKSGTNAIFIKHKINNGICKSLNEAINIARGQYFSPLAADDMWEANHLSTLVAAMEVAGASCAVAFADAEIIDENGIAYSESFIKFHRPAMVPRESDIFSALLDYNFIPGMATFIRIKSVIDIGGFDEDLIFEDWDMWLRLSKEFTFRYVPVKTARYRIVQNSAFRTLTQTENGSVMLRLSMFRIFKKVLHAKNLTRPDRNKAFKKLWSIAVQSFRLNDEGSFNMILQAALLNKEIKLLTIIVLLVLLLKITLITLR